jgi:hypothetical protein
MGFRQRGSIVASIAGIVACGGIGGVVAWLAVTLLRLDGAIGAIVAAVIGMVVAFAAWSAGVWLIGRRPRVR